MESWTGARYIAVLPAAQVPGAPCQDAQNQEGPNQEAPSRASQVLHYHHQFQGTPVLGDPGVVAQDQRTPASEMTATKLISGLTTLDTLRLRGDHIEVFKILNGYENIDSDLLFSKLKKVK